MLRVRGMHPNSSLFATAVPPNGLEYHRKNTTKRLKVGYFGAAIPCTIQPGGPCQDVDGYGHGYRRHRRARKMLVVISKNLPGFSRHPNPQAAAWQMPAAALRRRCPRRRQVAWLRARLQ